MCWCVRMSMILLGFELNHQCMFSLHFIFRFINTPKYHAHAFAPIVGLKSWTIFTWKKNNWMLFCWVFLKFLKPVKKSHTFLGFTYSVTKWHPIFRQFSSCIWQSSRGAGNDHYWNGFFVWFSVKIINEWIYFQTSCNLCVCVNKYHCAVLALLFYLIHLLNLAKTAPVLGFKTFLF